MPAAHHGLGRVYLAQGLRREAREQFQEAVGQLQPGQTGAGGPIASTFGAVLGGLEEACEDAEEFRAFCRRYQEAHPETRGSRFVQWFLEPAAAGAGFRTVPTLKEEFAERLAARIGFPRRRRLCAEEGVPPPDWAWQDPFGDCSFRVHNGLQIHARNGRDLWQVNVSAPRLLRQASGSFAIETVCLPVSEEQPAIGGLVLWRDRRNFLRLVRGTNGTSEVCFEGSLGNEPYQVGRGRLVSDRAFLRLERAGSQVRALCSADGEQWFTVGQVEFPAEDPLQIGLHAIGNIDRTIYHGAYPEGTAIRFESFQMQDGVV